jgi:hypothetical protein
VARSGARKKTHATQTTWKVTSHAAQAGNRKPWKLSRAQRSADSAAPWIPPQSRNVHAAPCHSPPSSMVSITLRYVFSRPPRLPPSGMYR